MGPTTQALTLEAGKYYRTVGGRKVKCVGASECDGDFVMQSPVGQSPAGSLFKVSYSGWCFWACSLFHEDKDQLQIVAEWVDLKRIKGRMYIGRNSLGMFGSYIRDDATPPQFCDVIACIEIDVLEGAGLEGAGQ